MVFNSIFRATMLSYGTTEATASQQEAPQSSNPKLILQRSSISTDKKAMKSKWSMATQSEEQQLSASSKKFLRKN